MPFGGLGVSTSFHFLSPFRKALGFICCWRDKNQCGPDRRYGCWRNKHLFLLRSSSPLAACLFLLSAINTAEEIRGELNLIRLKKQLYSCSLLTNWTVMSIKHLQVTQLTAPNTFVVHCKYRMRAYSHMDCQDLASGYRWL